MYQFIAVAEVQIMVPILNLHIIYHRRQSVHMALYKCCMNLTHEGEIKLMRHLSNNSQGKRNPQNPNESLTSLSTQTECLLLQTAS